MTVWFKQGVMGHLTRAAQNVFGRVANPYGENAYFVTSIQEGNHNFGSFHPRGDAWDAKRGGVSIVEIQLALGSSFDVVGYVVNGKDYIHCEYDPK